MPRKHNQALPNDYSYSNDQEGDSEEDNDPFGHEEEGPKQRRYETLAAPMTHKDVNNQVTKICQSVSKSN